MNDVPIRLSAAAAEVGWTPTAFVAVVEYVDPDGNPGVTVITSDGCSDQRRERMIAALTRSVDRPTDQVPPRIASLTP